MKLTVVIRDDGPLIFCNDSPRYRSVQIELTPEQESKLALRKIKGTSLHEEISKCFFEPTE